MYSTIVIKKIEQPKSFEFGPTAQQTPPLHGRDRWSHVRERQHLFRFEPKQWLTCHHRHRRLQLRSPAINCSRLPSVYPRHHNIRHRMKDKHGVRYFECKLVLNAFDWRDEYLSSIPNKPNSSTDGFERAATLRLPAVYQWPELAEQGGLLAYGPASSECFERDWRGSSSSSCGERSPPICRSSSRPISNW